MTASAEQSILTSEDTPSVQDLLVATALDLLRDRMVEPALAMFGEAFRDGIPVADDQVAAVLIQVTDAIIMAFEEDDQSPAAHEFFQTIGVDAASVIVGLIEIANFPDGSGDSANLARPIMLTYAGALSAAGRHDDSAALLAS